MSIREILEKLYEEGSFEGEHKDIHPDRIEEAELAIKKAVRDALLEKMPKKKEHITVGGLNSSDLADRINREIDIRNQALTEAIKVINDVLGGEK
jgi:hypothetical protein